MQLVFAGTPEFAATALEALHRAGHDIRLVLTQPDRPAGRGLKAIESPVKRYAQSCGFALLQPENFKTPQVVRDVAATDAEALVVAAYGLIVPQPLLDAFPLGALNIHASLLPRWRGAAPIQRAILAGDRETGISIMRMDAGLDTGPVFARQAIPIQPDDDTGTLHDKLADLGGRMIVETLARLEQAPQTKPEPQPAEGVTYAAKIRKAEASLDWNRSAEELERVVRAFRPAPGASTTLDGQPLKVWRASAMQGCATPGSIEAVDGRLIAGCGSGRLAIEEVQRPGARRLTVEDFLRGHRLPPNARFT